MGSCTTYCVGWPHTSDWSTSYQKASACATYRMHCTTNGPLTGCNKDSTIFLMLDFFLGKAVSQILQAWSSPARSPLLVLPSPFFPLHSHP
jgi:hypothetical protein